MEGLIEEGQELIDEIEKGPLLDAGLVTAARKVEHYEIAKDGSLCAIGRRPDLPRHSRCSWQRRRA